METYSVLRRGEYHLNFCEDYLIVEELGSEKVLLAVMDGCTNGIESYFASTLVGKLLRKITKTLSYSYLRNHDLLKGTEDCLKTVISELFRELKSAKTNLMLEQGELLATLLIACVDKTEKNGVILAIGDGLICINGKLIDLDSNNKPDYLGYHLDEHFDDWYSNQKHKFIIDHIRDLSLCTDGIFTFLPDHSITDPISFLISDEIMADQKNILSVRLRILENEYGLVPTDDLAITRLVL